MNKTTMAILDRLNEEQRTAATHKDGPLLVIAGPGTGKTLTIVARIVYLLEKGISPAKIVAITFTNKAAEEIRQRVNAHCGTDSEAVFIGTFHKFGLHILKEYLNRAPVIASEKEVLEILSDIAGKERASKLRRCISYFKNTLTSLEPELHEIYKAYEKTLTEKGLMDIDDIVLHTVKLLEDKNNSIHNKPDFDHIIVDEYQDINLLQYRLLRLVLGKTQNIFAVGDADQCIYSFRGSDNRFFLTFQEDFPSSTVVELTRSYRSNATILRAATSVIEKNKNRISITLVPDRTEGNKVRVISLHDDRQEAEYIAREIKERTGATYHGELFKNPGIEQTRLFSDFAILVRTHGLASSIRKALEQKGIPVRVVAERRLSEFPSTETFLDYLEAIIHEDEDALRRIINTPPRGIGPKTMSEINSLSIERNIGIPEVLEKFFAKRQQIKDFIESYYTLTRSRDKTFSHLCREIIKSFNLREYFPKEEPILEHMLSLSNAYDHAPVSEAFRRFREEISCEHEFDLIESRANFVPILTIHASKGLEFPVVFIAGAEEGIIPFGDADIEEERRLFYVAMTRAKEELIITHARQRFLHGTVQTQKASPFLSFEAEVKEEVFIKEPNKRAVQKSLFS
ncbi:MAG: ATP-dependent helicase [Nitrospirae bacterium]|nr:ATP-dependent helicase [Nitrospirota bacterium]